ncbi:MAG TPA: hypothetical protein VF974_02155 [Patescibacteria group bacterium]
MKLSLPKFKLHFGLIVNLILALVILSEIYFVYALLYSNMNPQPTEVVLTNIVKVDLKAYADTSDLLKSMDDYMPGPLNLQNSNPFKYSN